ncbi:IS1595 family transposase [Cohnella sp. JJ-181]|uniref:IS1595 family transposase n=1 Tax=Cohnella rhizoplanae TaxID=2974897 RepID=UPI0022FF8E2E|nr:IS1595 family transposase [Cohnella sp. JJ-181]CAI6056996.1 IS1595 family transposase ISPaen7 [Cohnella sp. JJ-181]
MLPIVVPKGSWETWTEEQCIEALYQARWPHGFRCPACNYPHCSVSRTRKHPLYVCSSCRLQTSITAGTVMHGTRTPLRLWFRAMLWIGEEATSVELSEVLGVTYKTAWLIGHKLRDALTLVAEESKLSGSVAVTGGVYGWRCFSSLVTEPTDQPIVIGAELDGEEIQFVKMVQMDLSVVGKSRLLTRYVYDVFSEFHAEVDFKRVKTFAYRGMKSFKPLSAILMKAMHWFDHTLQGLGPKHLQAYLNQQAFVYNINRSGQGLLWYLMRLCGSTMTITYRQLTRPRARVPNRYWAA